MRKFGIIVVLSLMALALAAVPALAQSGHFVTGGANGPKATLSSSTNQRSDAIGNLIITGKVAGLGGTTFEITATASGTANYACMNNGGQFPNDPKKQTVSGPVTATTGPLPTPSNGQYKFSLTLKEPASTLGCPGGQHVVLTSVSYSNVTLTLFEDDVQTDQTTVTGTFSKVYFANVP